MDKHFGRFLVSIGTILASGPVVAQSTSELAATQPFDLGTIILEGRKREEAVLDAPVSASIVDGEDIRPGSADPSRDIALRTPNFNFIDFGSPGYNFAAIRGVVPLGTPLNNLDNTIGYSTNGVPTSGLGFSSLPLDVERVEVLRGPQGTLFGRNALGGAINVVTRQADGVRDARLGIEVGDNGNRVVDFAAGGWLIDDTLAGRVALRYQTIDGDIPNPLTASEIGDAEIAAARVSLGFNPNSDFRAQLTFGYEQDERANPQFVLIESPEFPIAGDAFEPLERREISHVSLKVEREFEAFTFTSTTGFQDIGITIRNDNTDSFLYSAFFGDLGFPTPPSAFADPLADTTDQFEEERIFSQEFRLNSTEGSAIDWVAGLSYFRSEYDQDRVQQDTNFPSLNGVYDTQIDSETIAIFGDVTVPIGSRWNASAGLRLARDTQDFATTFVSNGFPGTVPFFSQTGTFEDDYVTGRLAVDYQWSDEVLSYASITRGYASGGFERFSLDASNGRPAPPFRPSEITTYEIGAKAQFLGGDVVLTGAAFYNDVTDGQALAFDPATFAVFFDNQDYESYGFDIEVQAQLSSRLFVRGAVGLTETELVNVDPANATGAVNGNEVPNSPNVTASLGLEYIQPLTLFGTSGDLSFGVDVSHVGSRKADIANSTELDSYTLTDLRIGWSRSDFEIYAYGRNIFDERPVYFASVFSENANAATVGRGRQIGIGANWRF